VVPIRPSVLMQRRAAECAASFLLSARCGEGGVALAMLVPDEEQGCTVIGCPREHHALLDYACSSSTDGADDVALG
jgi:hypothetical protein